MSANGWRYFGRPPLAHRGACPCPRRAALSPCPAPRSNPMRDFATRQAAAAALPFERPGMSFPGSAFYYPSPIPPGAALVALPKADPALPRRRGRPRAWRADRCRRACQNRSSPQAPGPYPWARAAECLAQARVVRGRERERGRPARRGAGGSEPRGAPFVARQRVRRGLSGIAAQRPAASSPFTCDGSLARRPSGASWARAQRVADAALSGSVYAPVGHATHYHTLWVNPYWAGTLDHVGTIGAHRFYRLRGGAGDKAAFFDGLCRAGGCTRPAPRRYPGATRNRACAPDNRL